MNGPVECSSGHPTHERRKRNRTMTKPPIHTDQAPRASEAPAGTCRASSKRHRGPIPLTLALALAVGGGYVAFQRVGTTANVETVTHFENYAGGFVAVGMTKRQPGFVMLSALEKADVTVTADMIGNRLAGKHSILSVSTPKQTWRHRLRGPQVVLVNTDGTIASAPVDWEHDDFERITEALDCERAAGRRARGCGQAFADLRDVLSHLRDKPVPAACGAFFERYVAPSGG